MVVPDINSIQKLFPTKLKVFRYNSHRLLIIGLCLGLSFRRERGKTLFMNQACNGLNLKAELKEDGAVAGEAFITLTKDKGTKGRKGEEVRYPQIRL